MATTGRGRYAVVPAAAVVPTAAAARQEPVVPTAAAARQEPVGESTGSSGIVDVPDVSAEWYLEIVDLTRSTPSWLWELAALFTEAVVGLFAVMLLLVWWRARKRGAAVMARALLAPAGVVLAYLASEFSKTLLRAPRPCHTFPDFEIPAECPPASDWAFPSNHATVAGAVAVGVLLAWHRLGIPTALLSALGACSRVFVGVHYPHDVLVGVLLGGLVASVVVVALSRAVSPLVVRLRERRGFGVLLGAGEVAEVGAARPRRQHSAVE
ncbi:undecaprenyl-diphosphatase [Actinopolyspora saharensis]|uniref:Undecaprenyl-diphosphatase n=2 Tax=Actinopolyspora saharensis TaxID=995062 RepID=A0A1H0YYX7_9ACTN|nr:undecaprenyl-diphosphatase [Actinopolyspora saharensis]